jgi:hypothetical protein
MPDISEWGTANATVINPAEDGTSAWGKANASLLQPGNSPWGTADATIPTERYYEWKLAKANGTLADAKYYAL